MGLLWYDLIALGIDNAAASSSGFPISMPVVIASAVAAALLIFAVVIIVYIVVQYRRKRTSRHRSKTGEQSLPMDDVDCHKILSSRDFSLVNQFRASQRSRPADNLNG